MRNPVNDILLALALPTIVIFLGLIMFVVGDMADDVQTIVDFIEASATPNPSGTP